MTHHLSQKRGVGGYIEYQAQDLTQIACQFDVKGLETCRLCRLTSSQGQGFGLTSKTANTWNPSSDRDRILGETNAWMNSKPEIWIF